MRRSYGTTGLALTVLGLALLALALAGSLRETGIERAAVIPIAGRMLIGEPGEILRGNGNTDNAAVLAEVPVRGLVVRAWLVREAVAEAEPAWPDCAAGQVACLRETPFDAELRIVYRVPAGIEPDEALAQTIRDWFAARLKPAESAR